MSPKPNIETGMRHTLITEKEISFGTLMTTGNYKKKGGGGGKRERKKERPPINLLAIFLLQRKD